MLEAIADGCHLDNLGNFIVQFEKLPLPMQQLHLREGVDEVEVVERVKRNGKR